MSLEMPRKRAANWDWDAVEVAEEPSLKRAPLSKEPPRTLGQPAAPRILHKPHAESGVGNDFHSVPYPLTLFPKKTWTALNQGQPEGAVCSQCGKSRPSSAHQRKLFLVAERLSWELGLVSRQMREDNEMALWAVNAELDIFEPVIVDEEVVVGGRMSKENPWYPYAGEVEADLAMRIVSKAEVLTEASWNLWKDISISPEEAPQDGKDLGSSQTPIDLTDEPGATSVNAYAAKGRRNPQSALQEVSSNSSVQSYSRRGDESVQPAQPPSPPSSIKLEPGKPATHRKISSTSSMDTLQDFYCHLDKIERTSNMGAKFLEAYAERLHAEVCKSCWFSKNVLKELAEGEPEMPGVPPSHGQPLAHQPSFLNPPGRPAYLTRPLPVMFGRPSALGHLPVHHYAPQSGTLPRTMQTHQPGSFISPLAHMPYAQPQQITGSFAPHPSTQGQFGLLVPQTTPAHALPPQQAAPPGPSQTSSEQEQWRPSGRKR